MTCNDTPAPPPDPTAPGSSRAPELTASGSHAPRPLASEPPPPEPFASSPRAAEAVASPSSRSPEAETPPHDAVLATLGRRFRGPALRVRCELRHSSLRQIYRRDFAYVSQLLHALESSRRVQGLPRDALAAAMANVGRACEQARGRLLGLAAEMRSLIALSGEADSRIEFLRPRSLLATIVSPHARDYIALLELADEALTQVERAWLLNLLGPRDRQQHLGECRRTLQDLKETVRDERTSIGALVREVNAARATETRALEEEPAAGGPPMTADEPLAAWHGLPRHVAPPGMVHSSSA